MKELNDQWAEYQKTYYNIYTEETVQLMKRIFALSIGTE